MKGLKKQNLLPNDKYFRFFLKICHTLNSIRLHMSTIFYQYKADHEMIIEEQNLQFK